MAGNPLFARHFAVKSLKLDHLPSAFVDDDLVVRENKKVQFWIFEDLIPVELIALAILTNELDLLAVGEIGKITGCLDRATYRHFAYERKTVRHFNFAAHEKGALLCLDGYRQESVILGYIFPTNLLLQLTRGLADRLNPNIQWKGQSAIFRDLTLLRLDNVALVRERNRHVIADPQCGGLDHIQSVSRITGPRKLRADWRIGVCKRRRMLDARLPRERPGLARIHRIAGGLMRGSATSACEDCKRCG